jgi:hypothetical protein
MGGLHRETDQITVVTTAPLSRSDRPSPHVDGIVYLNVS